MKHGSCTCGKEESQEDFLERARIFQKANRAHPFLWFTPLATMNKPACERARVSLRPLFGLMKYCFFHLPFFPKHGHEKVDVVFATVFIENEKGAIDHFFGDLPQHLGNKGLSCAYAGKIAWVFDSRAENKAARISNTLLFCPSHLLSKYDGLTCIAQALKARLSTKGMTNIQTIRTRQNIGLSCLHDIVIGLFYKKMLTRLKTNNPGMRIIHPFEGNTWESACAMVDDQSIGYQHGAILPNQTKIKSCPSRPLPSKIITSGPEASNALTQIGNFKTDKMIDGYALRLGMVYNYEPKTKYPKKFERFLYLLQGGEETTHILPFLNELRKNGLNITLRPHPAHPIGYAFEGFILSTEKDLYKDILSYDACIYASSTAAFESIALGVPTINIAPGEDPLFQCPALHYTAQTITGFQSTIIDLVKDNNFRDDFAMARTYFEGYFRQPNEQTKDLFNQWLTQS